MKFDIKNFTNPNLKDLDEYRHMYEKSVTDPSSFFLEHALKEIDAASLAVVSSPSQIVPILKYVIDGKL